MDTTCDGMRLNDEVLRCYSSYYGIGGESIPMQDVHRENVDAIEAGIKRLDGEPGTASCADLSIFLSNIVKFDVRPNGTMHRTFVNEAQTTRSINDRFGLQIPRVSRNEVWLAMREVAQRRAR